jgi:holo-[acyl-carrier protein] synthase
MSGNGKTYCGIDIVEISRVRQAIKRNPVFLNKIFTASELNGNPGVPSLAARFAAKEASMKALGTGMFRTRWKEIEVLNDETGRPYLKLHGAALRQSRNLQIIGFSVSLSHCRSYAAAIVISF